MSHSDSHYSSTKSKRIWPQSHELCPDSTLVSEASPDSGFSTSANQEDQHTVRIVNKCISGCLILVQTKFQVILVYVFSNSCQIRWSSSPKTKDPKQICILGYFIWWTASIKLLLPHSWMNTSIIALRIISHGIIIKAHITEFLWKRNQIYVH